MIIISYKGSKLLKFGREPLKLCPTLERPAKKSATAWPIMKLSGATTKEFSVKVGDSGGSKGYGAMTGKTRAHVLLEHKTPKTV